MTARVERIEEVSVADMMAAREGRYFMQQTLLARHPGSSLVCLTMNIAGPVKRTNLIEQAFAWGERSIRAVLTERSILFSAQIHEKTGPEAVFVFAGDPCEIKRRLCALEDGCAMGRLLDIDVIRPDGMKIARQEVGLPQRRCLLCGEAAPVCARSRAHTAAELFQKSEEIIRAHFEDAYAKRIGQAAQRALLYEVAVTPKPGLVDRANSGAHADMDVFTFIDSACALREYFETCAKVGLAHRGGDGAACFDALRVPGLLAESEMLGATGGVNTHKGAIFSLGIYCAGLGMGFDGEGSDTLAALARCGSMTQARMKEELSIIAARDAQTFGEEIYKRRGVGGVRQEAAGGFASVRDHALPRLKAALAAGVQLNDAGLCALCALMARVEDTNALRRGGEEAAKRLTQAAAGLDAEMDAAIRDGTICTRMEEFRARLAQWDAQLSAARISPGGCADLLALALLAHFMS